MVVDLPAVVVVVFVGNFVEAVDNLEPLLVV